MDNKGWREEEGWRKRQQGTAAHWRERETDKSKRMSYLFNSMDLKNTQEASMTEELIGFISHYLSFLHTFSLFYSHSLSHAALHTFS